MRSVVCVALNPTVDVCCDAARVQPIHKIRTRNQHSYPGSGGVNVARAIAELGGRPGLIYLAGGGTGALLEDLLSATPIDKHKIATEGSVRMAFMVHEEETGLEYRFVPNGPVIAANELALAFRAIEAGPSDYVVGSGSLPKGVPPDAYRRMANLVTERGGRFVLDASGPALVNALPLDGNVFLVKPSLRELETIAGHPLDTEGAGAAALDLVQKRRAQYVAVTMGHNGALLAGEGTLRRLPAHAVAVRSAVGAGDSFLGAMVWALASGYAIGQAFVFGAAAVMTPGTELFHRKDVLTLQAADLAETTAP